MDERYFTELTWIDRNRLCPTEEYSTAAEKLCDCEQRERQRDRAERIDVADRIQTHTAGWKCSHVSEAHRNVTVGRLVQRYRKYDG